MICTEHHGYGDSWTSVSNDVLFDMLLYLRQFLSLSWQHCSSSTPGIKSIQSPTHLMRQSGMLFPLDSQTVVHFFIQVISIMEGVVHAHCFERFMHSLK